MSDYRASHQGESKGRSYDEGFHTPGTTKHLFWTLEQKFLAELIRDLAPARALDVACGTGRVLKFLEGAVPDVAGVDVSESMVSVARERCMRASIHLGDITRDDSLLPGPFGLITAFRFFLNAEPELRTSMAQAIHRRLEPGGRLVANFHLNPFSVAGVHVRAAGLLRGTRRPMMSVAEARHLLDAQGFRIERTYGYGLLLPRTDRLRFVRAQTWWESRLAGRPGVHNVAENFLIVARRM